MPLATFIAKMLESGKIRVTANNVEALEIKAAQNKVDVEALNKDFVKEALAAARGKNKPDGLGGAIKASVGQIKAARSSLSMLKDIAEELSDAGVTVTLSYKGDVVLTVGSQANPKLSSVATKTKAVEINRPRKLIELGI